MRAVPNKKTEEEEVKGQQEEEKEEKSRKEEEGKEEEGQGKEEVKKEENKKEEKEAENKKKKAGKKKADPRNKEGLMERLNNIGTINQREIVEFTRHLAVMLTAGITIFEAVEFLKNQMKNKIFVNRLEHILDNLGNGQSLSTAMRRYPKVFPEIYVNMINIGEESGTLPSAMTNLANHLEENEKFRKNVKSSLIYPKIIFSVMIAFIIVLVAFVMPRILTVFESLGAEIPKPTQVIMATSDFVNGNLGLILFLIIALIVSIHIAKKHPLTKPYFDLMYIKAPAVGKTVLNYNVAQVSQHFGTLFESGITIVRCLEITRSVIQNDIFRGEIEYMINKIKGGASLSNSFPEKSFFPPMFIKLIKVGERTGQLPHVIDYMRHYYKELVDGDVKNITTIIEPVIMVLLGVMIAGLVVSVIGPIYQLISNVG